MSSQTTADQICADAVDLARSGLAAEIPLEHIGDHLAALAEAEQVVTHLFDCKLPGYQGWRWAVTLTRTPDSQNVTINEFVLLPGPKSILAPAWVPWRDRLRPGDLGPGDVLPTDPDDPRIVPGYFDSGDDEQGNYDQLPPLWALGLGRIHVMSLEGRDRAAQRWRAGPGGPFNNTARWAGAQCSTCAYTAGLAGSLGQEFGVCANEYAESDGQVVSLDHGCGAHSETPHTPLATQAPELTVDDNAIVILSDFVDTHTADLREQP